MLLKKNIGWITLVSTTLFVAILILVFPNPPGIDDCLRHYTLGKIMRTTGQFTLGWDSFLLSGIISELHVDPWYLSHIVYIPFTFFSIAKGTQLFAFVNVLILLGVFLVNAKAFKLPLRTGALLASLLLCLDSTFLYRLLVAGRPHVLQTSLMLLVLWTCIKRKWLLLGVLLAISTLLSHLFIFPLFVVGVFAVVLLRQQPKQSIRLIAAAAIGVLAGLLLHPHTTHYALYMVSFLRFPLTITYSPSREMLPGIWTETSAHAVVGFAILTAAFARTTDKNFTKRIWEQPSVVTLCILTLVFYAMFFRWNRALDYLWPCLLLFTGVLIRQSEVFSNLTATQRSPRRIAIGVIAAFCILNLCIASHAIWSRNQHNALNLYDDIAHVPDGSHILNVEWDIFSPLMTLQPNVFYTTGISELTSRSAEEEVPTLMSVAFSPLLYLDEPLIDTESWVKQLLHHFPKSDYLVLSTQRYQRLFPQLSNLPGLTRTDNNEDAIAVFAIEK